MPRQGNFYQTGNIIDFVNTTNQTIASGEVVPLQTRIGFAVADILPGATGGVAVEGVFRDVPADNTTDFAVGDELYWIPTDKKLTKTAANNIPTKGWCVAAKAKTDDTAFIKLVS